MLETLFNRIQQLQTFYKWDKLHFGNYIVSVGKDIIFIECKDGPAYATVTNRSVLVEEGWFDPIRVLDTIDKKYSLVTTTWTSVTGSHWMTTNLTYLVKNK